MAELYTLHRLTLEKDGVPLFAALAEALSGLSRHQARQTVTAGLVKIDGASVLEPKHELHGRVKVEVDLRHGFKRALHARIHAQGVATDKPFTIVYEDAQLVVVNKSPGILSAPMHRPGKGEPERGHVPELLRRAFRKQGRPIKFIGVVHRLDQDTSGCLCFALTHEAQRLLSAQFATHAASRIYRCQVMRAPLKDQDTISGNLGRGRDGRRALVENDEPGKEAITHFRVLKRFARGAELEVRLETGRTHQIRVSLAAIGCPVYGDRVYAATNPRRAALETIAIKAPRLMLHAHTLELDHPSTGKRLSIVAPLPEVFAEFAKSLQ